MHPTPERTEKTPEHPTEQEYRQKLARHLFRASHRWHREAAGLPDTEESFETSWAADGKQRSLFNCMAAWTIREIADWDRKQVASGIYSTQVGNERYAQLLAAESQNEALRGALDELLAWSDTMRVAYEHPFLNDTAIHNARKTLSTTPAKA